VDVVRSTLRDQRIHLLVLGYSAIDREVLTLLREAEAVIVSGRIVASGWDDAVQVHRRLEAAGLPGIDYAIPVEGDFEAFAQGTGISEYVDQVRRSNWNPWE
jgi:hypothetical protein